MLHKIDKSTRESICEKINVVIIYCKVQIYSKNDSNSCKTLWVLNHILNVNWLDHFNYNWKVWLMWFHKKTFEQVFHSNNISVLKKTFWWKITFIWKMNFFMLKAFVSKFIKMLDEIKEKLPQKILKNNTFSYLKCPPLKCAFTHLPLQ